jgi:formylglycine-generating enzyme required for sulfatase activity
MLQLMFVEIASDLVTNEEYWAFCDATGRDKGKTVGGRPKQPVTNVSWYDAMDYACWKAEMTGVPWRLPTEDELKAAETLIPEDADFSAWPLPELPDVGSHPETTNSLGHNDLVGVVYQWTMRPEDKVKYDKAWRDYVDRRNAAVAASEGVQPDEAPGEGE